MLHNEGGITRQGDMIYICDSLVTVANVTDALIEEAEKTPLHKQGSITRQGDMIAFVADGLNDMIKMSSPLSRTSRPIQ